jgi:hypothetical protein
MKLGWFGAGKNNSILTEYKGEVLQWSVGTTWSQCGLRGSKPLDDNGVSFTIFAPLNDYLNQLDTTVKDQLWIIFTDIQRVLNDAADIPTNEVNSLVYNAIYNIFYLIDYETFSEWCTDKGELNFAIGIKNELNDMDSIETTYFSEDYIQIVILSVYIKLIMPIWGMYHTTQKIALGDEQALVAMLNVFKNDIIMNIPAIIRLQDYIVARRDKKVSSNDFVLMTTLSSDELVDYCLIITLWKSILLFDARSQTQLIKKVFNALDNVFRALCSRKYSPSEKHHSEGSSKTNSDDEEGIGDIYRVVSELPLAIPAAIASQIVNDKFINQVCKEISCKEYNDMYAYIDKLEIRQSHLTICSKVCSSVLHILDIQYVNYLCMKRVIAVSACALIHWGYPSVADFITAIPQEINMNIISRNGFTVLPLRKDSIEDANKKFSHIGNINSLLTLTESFTSELICSDWTFKFGDPKNFANEFFTLMLK